MTDGLHKLPSGWRWVRLGEVATKPQYGYTYAAISEPAGPKFLRITDIQDSSVEWEKVPYCRCNAQALEKYKLTSGDLLFARSGATTGKTFLVRNLPYEAIFASYLIRLKPHITELLPEFAFWFFQSRQYWEQIRPRGAAQPNMNAQALQRLILPLPCLAEQHRIVSKVEALMERVHEAKRLREASRKDAETLFPSSIEHVLADAYANSPQIQPLGNFATAFNGRASGAGESEVRVFKTKHVYPFDLKQTDSSYMKPEQVAKCPSDRFLHSGDVLVCNIARGTLGRVCHVDSAEDNWTVDTQIMILRTKSRCLGKWLFYYLYSHRGQAEILAREKGIAFADKRGQTHLYPRDMLTVPVPLPSIDDQCRIVAHLDSVQAQTAALKRAQEDTDTELQRLEQAIWDRALRGEL